jgi:multisubunit Na+/H+ antiporter MnhB subunit
MAEPEPRYVLTFKPGSPEIIVVAIAALVGAGFTIFFSFVLRSLSCGEGDCGEGFLAMLVIACAGVAPLLGMLVESVRRRGHPWYWFFAAAFVYAFWGVVLLSLAS